MRTAVPYIGTGIINDPIHGYIRYTRPRPGESDPTERDLIDHPWVQRMRFISQLQSARWVYPAAEHSRFQHLLGAMAVASAVAQQIAPTLQKVCTDAPSVGLLDALLRTTALLHDVGHGPFSHFFDENYLKCVGLTHEAISAHVVRDELAELIRGLRRTPHATLEPGEVLKPEWVAYLILKGKEDVPVPSWVRFLTPIFGGIYTADNMDYVLRDSYMTGVKIGPVDIDRLIFHTFFTSSGLTLHRSGLQALFMFLSARIYLYQNVYYHRMARAIDIQMREIFPRTVQRMLPSNPFEDLDQYRELTDWSFFETVRRWRLSHDPEERELGNAWQAILNREVEWKPAFEMTLTLASAQHLAQADLNEATLEDMIRAELPVGWRDLDFRLDLAAKDARPLNPIQMGRIQIFVYDPVLDRVDAEPLHHLLEWLPARVVQVRVFTRRGKGASVVGEALTRVLRSLGVPAMRS